MDLNQVQKIYYPNYALENALLLSLGGLIRNDRIRLQLNIYLFSNFL